MEENQNPSSVQNQAPEQPPVTTLPPTIGAKPKFPLGIIIGIIIFILLAEGAAGYFVFKPQIEKMVIKTTPTPINSLGKEIQDFPIYPGASFLKKEKQPTCIGNESGFSYCNSTTYTWDSDDDLVTVRSWYMTDKSNSGWRCNGGAGDEFYSKTSCKIRELHYGLSFSSENNKTSIVLQIPYVSDLTASWKTYTDNAIFLKYPPTWNVIKEASFWTLKLVPDDTVSISKSQGVKEYEINISESENTKKLSAEEVWKERIKDGTRTPGFAPVTINGINGIRVSNNSLDSYDIQYYFTNDENIVLISLNYFMEDYEKAKKKYPDAEKTFVQILSTFKFTDSQTIDTSN